jgi:catechol 2,3-dioxygenase-like lactoylglutathione lyase family enzyme
MPIRGFVSHLDLNVSDPDASLVFYDVLLGHLGFARDNVAREPRARWTLTDETGAEFGVEIRPPAMSAPRTRHERYSPGIDHLALHAASRADVDTLFERLLSAGIEVADPPAEYDYTPGYYALALDDPDGIRLEVVHDPATNP